MTKIIAHRGYAKNHPQNTLPSFQDALELGADAIELDVHMTSDGELVVYHDYYLDDSGHSLIYEKDLSYVKSLDVGGESIPLLSEVFELVGTKMQYEIELKGFTADFLNAVIKLVKRYALVDFVEFTSPMPYILSRLHEQEPAFKTGIFATTFPEWMGARLGQTLLINNAVLGGVKVIHCPLDMFDKHLIREAHGKALEVHAADCNAEDELQKAFLLGVDQVSTDELEAALSVVRGV